jgi:hypothetical protein
MRYYVRADALASVTADGTVHIYSADGWTPTDTPAQALSGPGWRAISASQAVAVQRSKRRVG